MRDVQATHAQPVVDGAVMFLRLENDRFVELARERRKDTANIYFRLRNNIRLCEKCLSVIYQDVMTRRGFFLLLLMNNTETLHPQ